MPSAPVNALETGCVLGTPRSLLTRRGWITERWPRQWGRVTIAELPRVRRSLALATEVLLPGAPSACDAETDRWDRPSEARAQG
jgi:hypothetical protein